MSVLSSKRTCSEDGDCFLWERFFTQGWWNVICSKTKFQLTYKSMHNDLIKHNAMLCNNMLFKWMFYMSMFIVLYMKALPLNGLCFHILQMMIILHIESTLYTTYAAMSKRTIWQVKQIFNNSARCKYWRKSMWVLLYVIQYTEMQTLNKSADKNCYVNV